MWKHFKGKVRIGFVLLALISMLLVSACGGTASSASSGNGTLNEMGGNGSINVSIATHQPGIFFHSAGTAIAGVVSNHHDTINMTVRPYAGTTAWMSLVNQGSVDFGITEAANVRLALEGSGNFKKNKDIRVLYVSGQLKMAGYTVREDSGINSLRDLKGKRVAVGYNGDIIIQNLLELQLKSVGLSMDDIKPVPISDVGSGVSALRENRVDAVFTGDPTVGVFLELDDAVGIKALNLGDIRPEQFDQFPSELRNLMNEMVPTLEPVVHKAGFIKEETIIYQFPVALVSSVHVTDEVVYEIMKTLWEHYEELHKIFPWFTSWTPETMFRPDLPAPYHEGAVQFFKDQGLWTEEVERNHQELLRLAN